MKRIGGIQNFVILYTPSERSRTTLRRHFERCHEFSVSNLILVTGYGGFLGQEICRQLLQQGYRVRGLARGRYDALEAQGIEAIRGSATDSQLCDTALRGAAGVIHTAARAGVWGPARDYESINVDATSHLLRLALKHGVRAFVYTSSPSVTFDGSPQSNIDESAPYPKRWLCHYPRTKAIAERRVLDSHGSQIATCALRPHLIWGEGDPHLIPRVIQRCRAGRLLRVGDGKNLIDTVHVSAAAQAHVLALERLLHGDDRAGGRPYFLTDGKPLECWQWITQILAMADLAPPERSISLKTAYRLGGLLEAIYWTMRRTQEPPMTRFVAKQLGVDHHFCIDEAIHRLGYTPPRNRDELIRRLSPNA
jgi:2-alkyl-3-oxoalkanoate reductase